MKIADNIDMLVVRVPRGAGETTIYPTLVADATHLVLFDTGFPGTAGLIADAIEAASHAVADVTDIVLTHQDVDHIGGATDLLAMAPQATLHAPADDTPYIEGKKTPTKLAALEAQAAAGTLKPEQAPFYQMLKSGFATSYVKVDDGLQDGDSLDIAGGITVVATPGHTPGHASYYHEASHTMICGDAANIGPDGSLQGSNPAMTWDMPKATASLQKIKSYPMTGAISYHTGYLKF